MELYLLVGLVCGAAAAGIARHKGRSSLGWGLLGFLFGFIGLIVALLPSQDAADQRRAQRRGAAGAWRRCPVCAEAIRSAALKCRYCHSDVVALAD